MSAKDNIFDKRTQYKPSILITFLFDFLSFSSRVSTTYMGIKLQLLFYCALNQQEGLIQKMCKRFFSSQPEHYTISTNPKTQWFYISCLISIRSVSKCDNNKYALITYIAYTTLPRRPTNCTRCLKYWDLNKILGASFHKVCTTVNIQTLANYLFQRFDNQKLQQK